LEVSAIEFRVRMLINLVIILLGFWAPWLPPVGPATGFAPHISLLEWFALQLSRSGLVNFNAAASTVIVAGALLAAIGALLRVSGSAYLGAGTVQSFEMRAVAVMASGPYRYVRNPLYLGLWFMVAAIVFLMPPSGALVTMLLITLFQVRLILGEEAFLAAQLGEPYVAYRRAVPRLIPRLRGAPAAVPVKPQWLRAIFSELTPVGVFVALAFFSWTYDNRLMARVVLIAFGASLVARAFVPRAPTERPLEG